MKLESQTFDVDGRAITLQHGPSSGPVVVLLHGASGNAATWAPVVEQLTWATPVLVDLPGRGGSATVPPLDRADAVARWLGEVLDAADLKAPLVVGHSYGGAVALCLGLQRPGQQSLALVSSGSKLRVAPAIFELVRDTSEERPLPFDFAFGGAASSDAVATYHTHARGVPMATSLADWTGCDTFDMRERLVELRDPTLVLWGDGDTLTPPKRQQLLLEALPNASATELEGVGHMLPWEAPQQFSAALQAFANKA